VINIALAESELLLEKYKTALYGLELKEFHYLAVHCLLIQPFAMLSIAIIVIVLLIFVLLQCRLLSLTWLFWLYLDIDGLAGLGVMLS